MNLPPLQGQFPQTDIFFYVAADEKYFNKHGKALINSIKKNFNHSIHFHLYNPSQITMDYCKNKNISYTFEEFNENLVNGAYHFYKDVGNDKEFDRRRSKMLDPNEPYPNIKTKLVKTYYACARFVRLDEFLKNNSYIIMLDTDSLVRMSFELPSNHYDIHIFEKTARKHVPYKQHLASTIFYTDNLRTRQLIKDHSQLILEEFKKDSFYWFLDQETLDVAIQNYNKNSLSKKFVDFDMNIDSYIWCAKGPRKTLKNWLVESTFYANL